MWAKITAVFALLPKIVAVVQLVEELLDPSVSGEEKKQVALDALVAAGIPEGWVPIADGLIDTVVAVFNALGIFRKVKNPEEPSVEVAKLSATAVEARREADVAITDARFEEFIRDTQ